MPCDPVSGSDSASATRRAMLSCRRNRSPRSAVTVFDAISRPFGASTSCATARTWSPDRISVPITTRSTSASEASAFRSGASTRKRPATALERTTSDSMPDSVVVIASARLNARKSVSASGRRIRNGSTTSRVIVWARAVRRLGVEGGGGPQLLGHHVRRFEPVLRPLGQRPPDHAIDRRRRPAIRRAPAADRSSSRA